MRLISGGGGGALVAKASEAAARATPAGRLATACRKCVGQSRLNEFLAATRSRVSKTSFRNIAEGRLANVLARLTDTTQPHRSELASGPVS